MALSDPGMRCPGHTSVSIGKELEVRNCPCHRQVLNGKPWLQGGPDTCHNPPSPIPPPPHLLVFLEMLRHLCARHGLLTLWAENQESLAVSLVGDELGGGHASFAAGAEESATGLGVESRIPAGLISHLDQLSETLYTTGMRMRSPTQLCRCRSELEHHGI